MSSKTLRHSFLALGMRDHTLIFVSTTLRTPGASVLGSQCAGRDLLARVTMGENRWFSPVPLHDRLQLCMG